MEDRNIRNEEPAMSLFLNESVRLRNGYEDRLADRMSYTRWLCILKVGGKYVNTRPAVYVASGVENGDFARINKWDGSRTVADGHLALRALQLDPMMGKRPAVQGP